MITTPKQLRKQVARGGDPYSLDFDGANDYVEISHSDLDPTGWGEFTVSAWTWWDGGNSSSRNDILHLGEYEILLALNATDADPEWLAYMHNGTNAYSISTSAIGDKESWHLITAAYTGSSLKVYVDGEPMNENSNATGTIRDNPGVNAIGAKDETGVFFSGGIDNVRIYNRALSTDEISKLYKGVRISRIGLVGHWKFNEGEGTIAYDKSGNGNDGTLVNDPTWVTDTPL